MPNHVQVANRMADRQIDREKQRERGGGSKRKRMTRQSAGSHLMSHVAVMFTCNHPQTENETKLHWPLYVHVFVCLPGGISTKHHADRNSMGRLLLI